MKCFRKLFARHAALAVLFAGSSAFAGVPSDFSGQDGKWIVVNDNWSIDTEDVDRKGDVLRFWVRRRASGTEESSTQSVTTWTGKVRVRCGDFHARTEAGAVNGYGMRIYVPGPWERIDKTQFAYVLASNFCYLTGSPGYTAEPVNSSWQRKITEALKGNAPSPVSPSASQSGSRSIRTSPDSGSCLGGARQLLTNQENCG
jgi:hypothetical protein